MQKKLEKSFKDCLYSLLFEMFTTYFTNIHALLKQNTKLNDLSETPD